jgi:Glycosyl transferase family 2/Methyltransferase domain
MNSLLASNFFLKAGYRSRHQPEYFADTFAGEIEIVHQPDVYPLAAHLGAHHGCRYLIDIGCGRATRLIPLRSSFRLIGVDFGENIRWCRAHAALDVAIEWDLDRPEAIPVPDASVQEAVVVCADVIEHLVDPTPLIANLYRFAQIAPAVLVSSPERDLVRGPDDLGPPTNPAHVREWALSEFVRLFEEAGMPPSFAGLTRSNDQTGLKHTILVCFDQVSRTKAVPPSTFDVLAVVPVYNEQDVIAPVIRKIVDQGVRVRVIDNWSTDATVARIEALGVGERIQVERFPDTPSPHWELERLLRRVEQINDEDRAEWLVLLEADAVIRAPWSGVGLREALWTVQRSGFSAVDHTVLDFRPVDTRPYTGEDPEEHFCYFEFPARPGSFKQVRAWRRTTGTTVATLGGHDASFEGRRVFPYKFLLKHYSIRSSDHGRRKILEERIARVLPSEHARGWNTHYDIFDTSSQFVWNRNDLIAYDEPTFLREYLVERLSGVGIPRPPMPA